MTRVGVLGGGQLAKMLALAGAPLDIRLTVVEPAPHPPAATVAQVVAAPYDSAEARHALASCDVVTVELENVPVEVLVWLAERVPVHPSPDAVAAAQDRRAEKLALRAAGAVTAPIDHEAGLPAIVKARYGGYDGRAQRRVETPAELAAALAVLPAPIVEGVVEFGRELSVIGVRGHDGVTAIYPLIENVHCDGLLHSSRAPAIVSAHARQEATRLVHALTTRFDYVGVLAVELFDTGEGLVANEMAPRVHNSGHWTIEGAVTSQFEQHLRAICGLPLGETAVRGVAAMINLIGRVPHLAALLAVPGAHVHIYGKQPRAGRKLGHVTVVADDADTLDGRLLTVERLVAEA